jgi:uncharacterized protein YeaO (DUF488 family)
MKSRYDVGRFAPPLRRASSMPIATKRAYDKASASDGTRVLVDRLWPRGISKSEAHIDAWLKELAPSNELRKWYHARPQSWLEFRRRYLAELNTPEATAAIDQLHRLAGPRKKVTLVFASKNEDRNNAVVLKELLEGMRKPPLGTGPESAASSGRTRAARIRMKKR